MSDKIKEIDMQSDIKIKIVSVDGKWKWKLFARNGQALCESTVRYNTKQTAIAGARVFKWNMAKNPPIVCGNKMCKCPNYMQL